MSIVLLRLEGPLQSWGVDSRYDVRATRPEPTKSGVLGLVSAALGRDREDDVSDLAALRFGVRSDRPGRIIRDYHTAQNIVSADAADKRRSVISERYYISDACFLGALEGAHAIIQQIHAALARPAVALSLGRRSCPPSTPVHVPGGLLAGSLGDVLRTWPLLSPGLRAPREGENVSPVRLRVAIESDLDGADHIQADQPVGRAFRERSFRPRGVRVEYIEPPRSASEGR